MAKQAHYRITWGGGFGSATAPVEQWQTSVLVDEDSPATNLTTAVALDRATTLFQQFETLMIPRLDNGVGVFYCDIRKIGADGLQPRNPDGSYAGAARYTDATPAVKAGTPRYPFQIATVATLLTARQGPSGKGRMFFPAPAEAIASDGRLDAGTVNDFAFGVASLLNAVNGLFEQPVSVMSSLGFASTVTGVRVGRALDTHRSRRRSLLETPGTVAAVTP